MELKNFRLKSIFEYKFDKEIINLEKEYGKYCYIPLDIPIIKDQKILEWFFEHSIPIYKVKPDISSHLVGYDNKFLSIDYVDGTPSSSIWTTNILDKKILQNITDQLYEYFPVDYIDRYSLWSSVTDVGFHRDQSIFLDLPCDFRSMLYDDNVKSTLFLEEFPIGKTTSVQSDIFNLHKLTDTNSFVWNNLRVQHGSKYFLNHKKILLILKTCKINWKKYKILIEKSLEKYNNFLMLSRYNIENFVDNTYNNINL